MIVDELITLLRFDLPSQSKAALSGVNRAVSGITDKIKGLGIVSTVTSGIFAAFTVNAAKDAVNLANLSESIGVNSKEIKALGAVYEQLGGSAKSFAADADAFRRTTGQALDLDKMVELSGRFQEMSEAAAYQLGRAYGFSDDMIRVLRRGPDELRKMAEFGEKWGTVSEKATENLIGLNREWSRFSIVMDGIGGEVQGAFAPMMTEVLADLQTFFKENKDDIISGAEAIAGGLSKAWGIAKEAGAAAYDALKPAWDVLNEFVKEHGGWEDAIAGLTLALGALTAVKLVTGIFSFSSSILGLGSAAGSLATAFAAGGPLLLALAAFAGLAYVYRDDIKEVLDGMSMDFEDFRKKAEEFSASAKNMDAEKRGKELAALENNRLGRGATTLANTVGGAIKKTFTTGDVKETWKAVEEGLTENTGDILSVNSARRAEVGARAGEDVAEKMDDILGGVGFGASDTAREYAEIIAAGEIEKETGSVPVRRSFIPPQRMRGDFPEITRDDMAGMGKTGSGDVYHVNQNIYQMTPPTPMEELRKIGGGASFQPLIQ